MQIGQERAVRRGERETAEIGKQETQEETQVTVRQCIPVIQVRSRQSSDRIVTKEQCIREEGHKNFQRAG